MNPIPLAIVGAVARDPVRLILAACESAGGGHPVQLSRSNPRHSDP
ncbi:MAG: hypothetical protein IT578_00045 [Verrucomicrobiae bacterium]|nr:hypothetical protein [Verrucomicrobiae bacterium]